MSSKTQMEKKKKKKTQMVSSKAQSLIQCVLWKFSNGLQGFLVLKFFQAMSENMKKIN